jgi:transposase-like protein
MGLLTRISAETVSAIDAEIKRDPDQFTKVIAEKLGVRPVVVSARRNVLNLPGPRGGGRPITDKKNREIFEYLKNHPDESNVSIGKKFGVAPSTIGNKRNAFNLTDYPTERRRYELVPNAQRRKKLSEETKARIARDHLNGVPVIEIAKEFGISQGSVTRTLKERGVSRGTRKDNKPGEGTPPVVSGKMGDSSFSLKRLLRNKRIVEMYESGKTSKQIAKAMGLSRNQVNVILKGDKPRVKKADNTRLLQILEDRKAARKALETSRKKE